MKLLAFSIDGTPVPLPSPIAVVNSQVGRFGFNGIKFFIDLFIFFGIFLCLGFVIFGGFKYLISQGDKKKLEDARHTILFSVVGLILIFLAFLIVNVVLAFFNVPQFINQ